MLKCVRWARQLRYKAHLYAIVHLLLPQGHADVAICALVFNFACAVLRVVLDLLISAIHSRSSWDRWRIPLTQVMPRKHARRHPDA